MIKGNYLKGLKGLTKQDRQNWEKQYSSLLQGKTYDDDLLDELFSRFCLGKQVNL